MTAPGKIHCAECGRPTKGTDWYCKGCYKRLLTDAKPRWLGAPRTPALLRATTKKRSKDKMTMSLFDDPNVGIRVQREDDHKKRRKRGKRK